MALAVTLLGLAAGLVVTLALAGTVESLLFQVSPYDPYTQAGAVLVLLTAATAAAVVPARRAAAVSPTEAIREG